MKNLEVRIEKMLAGEQKRKVIALNYIGELESVLSKNGHDIWGSADSCTVIIDDEYIYFRHDNVNGCHVGFYVNGEPIEDLKGGNFWGALSIILEWTKTLEASIDKREEYRESIVAMIPNNGGNDNENK